jgi:drug/metabolite transporter (DMT)-like permease
MKQLALTALLLSVTALWGWTFPVVKEAVTVYGVASFLAVRFAVASAALGTLTLGRINRRSLQTGGAIGVVLAGGYFLQTYGLLNTTATNCGLITGLFVLLGPLLNRLLFGVRVRPALWLAIAVSIVGLALLTGTGPVPFSFGDGLTLGATFCYGLHIALLDRFAKGHDPMALALGQTFTATLIFVAAWPLTDSIAWPTRDVWFVIVITGVFATAAAYSIQTYVQQRLSAVRTAVILTTEPLFAAMFGYLLAGDRLTAVQLLGAALMLGAVAAAEIVPAAKARA